MFPDSPFAVPRGSFERPVPLVLVDPCDDPSITVKIARPWVPYVLGALQQLVLQSTWDTTDPDALWLVQQRAMSLLSCVIQAYDEPQCDPGCLSYALDSPILTWEPTNPFSDPEYVPPGYRFPSWFIADEFSPLPGVKKGDMITDLLHGPIVEPLSSGFPRFRITCSGTGTIEVEFVRFPTAGVALVTIDGDLGSARWVDLSISLAASIGSAESEMIIPIEITAAGNHVIDISMVYSFTEDPPFVHFGGGIRKIELCGFGQTPEPIPLVQYANLTEYPMPICNDLRFHNGKLQGLCCFNNDTGLMEWEDIRGQDGGVINDTAVTPEGTSKPAAGDSTCYNAQLGANSIYQFPWPVSNGDTITVSQIKGAWTDGAGHWYCPDGTPYVLNLCIGVAGHVGGDPSSTAYHMQLIAFDGTTYYPITDGVPFTIAGLSDQQMLTIFANDATRGDNAGTISFKVCGTNNATPPVTTWCRDFNFVYGDKLTWNEQNYTVWTGNSFLKPSGTCDLEVVMDTSQFAGSVLTKMEIYMGVYSGGSAFMGIGYVDGSGPHNIDLPQGPIVTIDMPDVVIFGGTLQLVGDECGVTEETVTRITVYGTGTPPTAGLGC